MGDRWRFEHCLWHCQLAGDSASVPAEKGVGGDDPTGTQLAGERGCDGAEQGSVFVVEVGSAGLAPEDAQLMAEHDDLEVLGASRSYGEPR